MWYAPKHVFRQLCTSECGTFSSLQYSEEKKVKHKANAILLTCTLRTPKHDTKQQMFRTLFCPSASVNHWEKNSANGEVVITYKRVEHTANTCHWFCSSSRASANLHTVIAVRHPLITSKFEQEYQKFVVIANKLRTFLVRRILKSQEQKKHKNMIQMHAQQFC